MQRSDEFLRSRRNIFGQLGPLRAKSDGPAQKTIYTVVSGKNPFPDVANQRNIPRYAMAQTILGQMTDQFTADMVMRATNPDYYSPRSSWDSASQLVLQVRRRDPEQWAYYYIRDKATQWKQARQGVSREHGSYDSPDAEALRNFRRSIYAGDVEAAKRLYVRLLGFGYIAQRFEQGIKASEPLGELSAKDGSRKAFVDSLSPYDRKMLDKAQVYEMRLSRLKLDARRIFPVEIQGVPAATRKVIQMYQGHARGDFLEEAMSRWRYLCCPSCSWCLYVRGAQSQPLNGAGIKRDDSEIFYQM